jgi:hypothetical protein
MIKEKKNTACVIAIAALSVFCMAGCHSNTMSADDAKNFKPTGERTPEVQKKIAAGIGDFYKKHPQYNQSNAAPATAAPATSQNP